MATEEWAISRLPLFLEDLRARELSDAQAARLEAEIVRDPTIGTATDSMGDASIRLHPWKDEILVQYAVALFPPRLVFMRALPLVDHQPSAGQQARDIGKKAKDLAMDVLRLLTGVSRL